MTMRLRLVVVRVAIAIAAFVLGALAIPSSARADAHADGRTPLRVLVPDGDNLQYMSFWVALGAGYFRDEGVDVDVVLPPAPGLAQSAFLRGEAEVAVLSPPMYLGLVSEEFPFVLVANLLQNDPIDLVVQGAVFAARGLRRDLPLRERLLRLHGLRIGVAKGPPTRLRALFSSMGLDADQELQIVTLHGRDQNAAFERHDVDALYAHTPYLETALVDQGARVVVDQAGGEVPELAGRQIHALAATRAFAAAHPAVLTRMTRAIRRAQRLVHEDGDAAVLALRARFPEMAPRRIATIVGLYAPAIPATPKVTAEGFARALALYPASGAAPDLSRIELSRFVAPAFADALEQEAPRPHLPQGSAAAIGAALLAVLAVLAWADRRPVSSV